MKSTCILFGIIGLTFTLHAHQVEEGIVVEQLQKTSNMWNGEPLPAYPEGQPEITILKITVPPKTSLPWHHHPVINSGVLISGELVVTDDEGNTLRLQAGDSISELVGVPHYGRNPTDTPAVIVVFYAGIQGEPITVVEE